MNEGRIAELTRRGVVAVGGPEAEHFLNNLVTAEVTRAAPGQSVLAALLSPQGKILFDFIIVRDGERFMVDIARDQIEAFIKRLTMYRLRAKVTIEDVSAANRVVALWGANIPHIDGAAAPDPRLASLGWRIVMPSDWPVEYRDFVRVSEADYDRHRIALGIPEGGIDFAFGDAFPHDADMDDLGGVDFDKGCYIGQEVVSRMEHRGTARRRFITVTADAALPAPGTELKAGERPVGTLGSSADGSGLALVRLDRAKEALDAGTPIMADGTPVTLTIPGWAEFGWPESAPEAEPAGG